LVLDEGNGIYEAMNLGIATSTGKFVCFWNSGDQLYNSRSFQELLDTLARTNEPWFVCKADLEWTASHAYNSKSMSDFLLNKHNSFISHQAVLIDRLHLKKIGIFNTKYRVAADTDLLIRCNYEFGEPQFFNKVIVHVQTPQFAAKNNRRSRFEIFRITLVRFKFDHKCRALSNLLVREISDLIKKFLVSR